MRVLVILGVIFLSGCGSFVPLEELERQAALTGDWSAVEQRERVIARREARRGVQCPVGYVNYCTQRIGTMECQCVGSDAVRDVLAGIR